MSRSLLEQRISDLSMAIEAIRELHVKDWVRAEDIDEALQPVERQLVALRRLLRKRDTGYKEAP